jgi:radical SAM superfamily enzyme YgiQ (UPF0313 family)
MNNRLETIIAFPCITGKRIEPPVNVLPMAGCVDRQGISSVRVIDGESLHLQPEQLTEEILKNRPAIVGISVYTPAYPVTKEILARVKTLRPEVLTVLGGKHPTHFYREVLEDENADIVVVGEGEEILPRIVAATANGKRSVKQSLDNQPGIAFKGDSNVPLSPKVDIKNLPPLDFQFLYPDLNFYLKKDGVIVDMESSRGCFNRCSFCLAATYRKGISYKEPEQFVNEIQDLNQKGVKHFFLTDDDFMTNINHTTQIVAKLNQKGLAPEIEANVRADSLLKCVKQNPQLLTDCKHAGINTFHIGVESANLPTLEYIKKHIDLNQIRQAVNIGTQAGVTVITNFIVGLPYDTEQSIQDSINFAEELKQDGPHLCHISIFMPYPGTEAYTDAVREGLLDPRTLKLDDLKDVHDKAVIPTTSLTTTQVESLYNKFYKNFYSPEYMDLLLKTDPLKYQSAQYLVKKLIK